MLVSSCDFMPSLAIAPLTLDLTDQPSSRLHQPPRSAEDIRICKGHRESCPHLRDDVQMCWWLLHQTRGIYNGAQKSPFAFPNTVVKLICKDRQINNGPGNSSCYFRELEKMNVLSSVLASCAPGRLTSLGRVLRAQSLVPGVCFTSPASLLPRPQEFIQFQESL